MSLLWTLAACSGESDPTVDATGPRTWDGDFLVDSVVIDCDGASEWVYDVRTEGWGDEVTVEVIGSVYGAIILNEHHALAEIDHGEDWAQFQVVLDQARYGETYESSRVTEVDCAAKTLVTYAFATWRYGGEMDECIAYGVDPEGLVPDCESWGTGH